MKSTGLLLLATALAAAGCDTTPTQPDAQPLKHHLAQR